MKKIILTALSLTLSATGALAENLFVQSPTPITLDVEPMSPEVMRIINQKLDYDLTTSEASATTPSASATIPSASAEGDAGWPMLSRETLPEAKMDFDFFKSKTNPDVPAFKVMDDLTFVGIPVFVAGILAKPQKKSFRQNNEEGRANTMLLTNFKTHIDDYTQYFGPAMTVGLKIAGYEGRSDWPRLLASAAMSYGIMAALVNGIKYTAKEMRPDGTSANSWPSGHTATSFVGATMLHKEYGLTRSPWFSVAGYGVATATGVMRVLNNRHWVSDVLSGAGIGIMSAELGYALSDIIFKQKGLLRGNLEDTSQKPSFFAISMGLSMGTSDFAFTADDLKDKEYYDQIEEEIGYTEDKSEQVDINFHTATTVDAEGAVFFNKYVGVGGRLRVRAMTAKNWNEFADRVRDGNVELAQQFYDEDFPQETKDYVRNNLLRSQQVVIESDHLTEFSASAGLYLNLPLGSHFALGTKALIGHSMTQELDINSKVQGNIGDVKYRLLIENGAVNYDESFIDSFTDTGKAYDNEWDILTMGGNSATTFGTGLSLTYKYKSNFSWRLFADYDYIDRRYTLTYDPYHFIKYSIPSAVTFFEAQGVRLDPLHYEKKKKTHYLTLGASFAVNF